MDGVTQQIASARHAPALRFRPSPRMPSRRRAGAIGVVVLLLVGASTLASTLAHLRVADPTGAHAVGKQAALLEDAARPEPMTPSANDHRQVRLVAWYPAVGGTGEPATHIDDLETIGDAMVASGSIGSLERAGLGFVTDPASRDANVVRSDDGFPVVLLSPGNATNVEFYASIAEDLASHGYVVIGIDHPFQSAAVDIGDSVAAYAGDAPLANAETTTRARIAERVADIGFVIDRLAADAAGLDGLHGRLDLDRLVLMGHSNGGLAAVEACDDPRVRACLNLDGQGAGGPFGTSPEPSPPANPFLFLTKETELHPALAETFEAGGRDTFRVVLPAAEHDSFTDGPRFRPRVLPTAGVADDVTTVTRGFVLAFLDHVLRGAPRDVFGDVDAPTDVQVYVYPLFRAD